MVEILRMSGWGPRLLAGSVVFNISKIQRNAMRIKEDRGNEPGKLVESGVALDSKRFGRASPRSYAPRGNAVFDAPRRLRLRVTSPSSRSPASRYWHSSLHSNTSNVLGH